MIKKISVALLAIFITCAAVHADWKTELTRLLANKKDYKAAFYFLETNLNSIDNIDKPFGYLTLAYCGHKLLDKELETRWISIFFETYKGNTDLFPLTDYALNRKIGNYLREWRKKYPSITQIGLIKDSTFNRSALPGHLTLGIEVSNETHYRLLYKRVAPAAQDATLPADKSENSVKVHFSHTFSPGINKKGAAPPTQDATSPADERENSAKVHFSDTFSPGINKKGAAPPTQDATSPADERENSAKVHFSPKLFPAINKEEVAAGGLLRKGFNFVEIPADRLFKRSDTHRFILDLKAGDLIVHKEIELNIICDLPANSGQVKDKIRESGYGVAMFIQNRLIAFHKKSVKHRRLSWEENDRQKRRGDILTGRPPDPLGTGEKELQRASFPVLAIPVSFFKRLIKPKLKKKPKKQIKTFNHLASTFLIKDSEGTEKPLDVTVTLKLE